MYISNVSIKVVEVISFLFRSNGFFRVSSGENRNLRIQCGFTWKLAWAPWALRFHIQKGRISRKTKTEFGYGFTYIFYLLLLWYFTSMYIKHSVFHVYWNWNHRFTWFHRFFHFSAKNNGFFCVLEETWISQIDTMVNLTFRAVVSKIMYIYIYVHPDLLGNDPIWLADIFQMGWFNYQFRNTPPSPTKKRGVRLIGAE